MLSRTKVYNGSRKSGCPSPPFALPIGWGENSLDESAHCTHEPPHLPYGHPLPLSPSRGKGRIIRSLDAKVRFMERVAFRPGEGMWYGWDAALS